MSSLVFFVNDHETCCKRDYEDSPFRIRNENGIVRCPDIVHRLSWVIRNIPRDGVWKSAAWVVVSVQHIFYAVSGLRSSQTRPNDLNDFCQRDGFA